MSAVVAEQIIFVVEKLLDWQFSYSSSVVLRS